MGGSIHVSSVEGEGSTFWFSLRLRCGTDTQTTPAPVNALRGLRVLIVDDNAVNRRVIHEQIASWGMRNGSYASAEQALIALQEAHAAGDPYDVVIADYQMPGIDGLELAAAIRRDPAFAHVAYVMLTSLSQTAAGRERMRAGVDACLVKPVRHTRLMQTLATALAARQPGRCEPAGPALASPAARPSHAHMPGGEFAG